LQPHVYAEMLVDKILRHQVRVWLINTGWTGGSYTIGNRIRLPYTRAMVSAVLAEKLDQVAFHIDPYFGLSIPNRVPGVPAKMLQPVYTWNDRDAYEQQATRLVERFEENFDQFRENVPSEVVYAGPRA
jgi:phosphoenolpyruvate carboxykinase (ATP)